MIYRVSQKGSVYVEPLFEVQSFRTVHQLVSKVHAQIAPNYSSFDAIRYSFQWDRWRVRQIAAMEAEGMNHTKEAFTLALLDI